MSQSSDEIKTEIAELKSELEKIKEILSKLTVTCERIEVNCSKMSGHINFVEDTYEKFKHPLAIVKTKIESVFGKNLLTD